MTNLVLTGFMGTGKTSIGRKIAHKLGYKFIDMDEEIEKQAGKSINRIFQEEGEIIFRKMETDLCLTLGKILASKDNLVISTGGGTMLNPTNHQLLSKNGMVLCLSCSLDETIKRLGEDRSAYRPLLKVADRRRQIEQLLQARGDIYASFPWQIDTTSLNIDEVTEKISKLVNLNTLLVQFPGGQYPVYLGLGGLDLIGEIIQTSHVSSGCRVGIISNPVVAPLYMNKVKLSIQSKGYDVFDMTIPNGEEFKTLGTVNQLYDQLLFNHFDRNDLVVSLGGGVTSDIAGFVAATFMRGVQFAQIPTTLLSMVDASVGGKTGVDLPQGKNLVGAFKQPIFVLVDPSCLATLSVEEIRSGMAEMIKQCIIADPLLFNDLEKEAGIFSIFWDTPKGSEWIYRALKVKINIVEQDPFEKGRRAVLNLGHTVGHALEKISGYQLRHGEAVSIGILAAFKIGSALNLVSSTLIDRVERLLLSWKLPTKCPAYPCDDIIAAMDHDKKKSGKNIRWVLPNDIGKVDIYQDVPLAVVKAALNYIGAI